MRKLHSWHFPISSTHTPLWPGDPPIEFVPVASIEKDGYFLRQLRIGEHSATHLNAPCSFVEDGLDICQLVQKHELHQQTFRVYVIPSKKLQSLTLEDILDFERDCLAGQRIEEGSMVFCYTGWAETWWPQEHYVIADSWPGFDLEAAKFLVESRSVCGIGVDTHGIDGQSVGSSDLAVNKYCAMHDIMVFENVALKRVHLGSSGKGMAYEVAVGALELEGGSGTLVTLLAFDA